MAEKESRELSDSREKLFARFDELKTAKAKDFRENAVDVLKVLLDNLVLSRDMSKAIWGELDIVKQLLWTEVIENAEHRQDAPLSREMKKDLATFCVWILMGRLRIGNTDNP